MKHSGLKLGSIAFLFAAACTAGHLDNSPINPNANNTVYNHLGGEEGIKTAMTAFVSKVVNDPRINGYFLNAKFDGYRLINCLVLQVGSLTGGPQIYPSMGCRDMKSSHTNLKISMNDFSDLAADLVATLQAAKVAKADIDAVVKAVSPYAPEIVEDPNSNGTVYQRVGRKPAITAVVKAFTTRVVGDARINGFFSKANADRLGTCLVRQVCSIDGPCKYGEEVDGEPGVSRATPCKDMTSVHTGMTSPPGGGAEAKPLTIADFNALVEDLVIELDAAKVSPTDKNAVLGALGPLCKQIVAGGTGCS
jgi:truncated hemoglobin YjbI